MNNSYKKIIVTGSTGVVGYALQAIKEKYPKQEFVFANSKSCDLTDGVATSKFITDIKPDAILHLAAKSGGIGISLKYPARILRDNVLMNFNVVETARKCNVKKVVMTLSSGMYPPSAALPLKEECMHNGNPHPSNYSYSFAKRLVEPIIRAYRTEYGMSIIGLVPNGIFGENDNFNDNDATMLASLIRRFYENKDNDSKITIWGDGSPLREYTYARDIARAYMWCLFNYDKADILNIGNTEEYSIKDFAYMIAEIMNIDRKRIEFDVNKPKGVFKKSTDNSRFLNLSGFAYTPLKTGLKNTLRWFAESHQKQPSLIKTQPKITDNI